MSTNAKQTPATAAAAAKGGKDGATLGVRTGASILQTANTSLDPPKSDEVWSSWYTEQGDTFADFKSYEPPPTTGGPLPSGGGSMRTFSARQLTGQFEEEVAKSWEEDWEDEDVEDTFDHIMRQISGHVAPAAATGGGK